MSEITNFYIRDAEDRKSRTLAEMQSYDDQQIEGGHDFIQWQFPLHEKSYHAVYSPVLTKEDISELQSSRIAKQNILTSLDRFMDFLGVGVNRNEKKILNWCNPGNHNLLRITRIIRSLRLFDLENYARGFYNLVVEIAEQNKNCQTALHFWKKAMEDDVMESLTEDFLKLKRINL